MADLIHMIVDGIRVVMTSLLLGVLLAFAVVHNWWEARKSVNKEEIKKVPSKDLPLKDVQYFCTKYNIDCEEHSIQTDDGFVLLAHRLRSKKFLNEPEKADKVPSFGHPIVLQHGLFMGGGVFVLNEESSLAFYLADHGYDVWLGNNRGVILKHKDHHHFHQRFWDWTVDDLAKYDMPAIVNHVLRITKKTQSYMDWPFSRKCPSLYGPFNQSRSFTES